MRSRSVLEVNFTGLAIFLPISTFNASNFSELKINVGSRSYISGSEVKHGRYEVKVNIRGQFHKLAFLTDFNVQYVKALKLRNNCRFPFTCFKIEGQTLEL